MTAWTGRVPFTVDTDLDLGSAAAPWLRECGADVTIRRGVVPDALPDAESEGVAYQSAPGRILIAPPCGARFLVENGTTIRYAAGDNARPLTSGSSCSDPPGPPWPCNVACCPCT